MRFMLLAAGSIPALALAGPALAAEPAEVVDTYADLAEAGYSDSLLVQPEQPDQAVA